MSTTRPGADVGLVHGGIEGPLEVDLGGDEPGWVRWPPQPGCRPVETHGHGRTLPEDATPALILRDLAGSPLASVNLGAEDVPVLTLTGAGDTLTITLECAPGQLSAPEALDLLTGFAGRLAEPLRHLL